MSNPGYWVAQGPINDKDYVTPQPIPNGMFAIFSDRKISGRYQVIGYTDGNNVVHKVFGSSNKGLLSKETGDNVVFFSNAPTDVVGQYVKKNNLQPTSKDGSTGAQAYQKASAAAAKQANTADPNAAQSAPGTTNPTTGASGTYNPGAGSTTANGNLSSLYSGIDDTTATVTVGAPDGHGPSQSTIDSLAAMGGGNYSFTGQSKPISSVISDFLGSTPDQQAALAKKLVAAGYKPAGSTPYDIAKAYEAALQDLYEESQAKPGDPISVDQFLAAQTQAQQQGATSKTHNVNDSTIKLTDPNQARGLVQKAIADALGRNPTAAEIAQFTASLQAAEKANPQITTGSTTTDQTDGTTTSSSTTQSGGLSDPSSYAQQWVEQNMPGQVHASSIGTNLFSIIAGAMNGNTS